MLKNKKNAHLIFCIRCNAVFFVFQGYLNFIFLRSKNAQIKLKTMYFFAAVFYADFRNCFSHLHTFYVPYYNLQLCLNE